MAQVEYEVRVLGRVGPAAREAFEDVVLQVEPTETVLSGVLDQAALHGLVERTRRWAWSSSTFVASDPGVARERA
jgi:hypothetical protein